MSICLALLLAALSGCGGSGGSGGAEQSPASPSQSTAHSAAPTSQAGTVKDYFPILQNVHYIYQGAGNEFASYDMYIDYTSDTKVQQRINNGGTVVVRVIEVADGKVTCAFKKEESYSRENFLDKKGDTQEILLKDPIEAGTSWTLEDGRTRTITGVSVAVDTPSGSYSAITVETKDENGKTTEYYAKNVGLVKTETTGKDYKISSTLSEIKKDASFVQTVRFYYPNINDGNIYYKDKELNFKTNDITKKTLETAYKEQPPGEAGKVFSENTKINSYYLNQDGMVYLDLSREFVSEMNAGSGYEAMVLQCVANTFGSYYNAEKVILTIEGAPYESGHIKMAKGEYLTVKTDGAAKIN
jgi:hypothetical protein